MQEPRGSAKQLVRCLLDLRSRAYLGAYIGASLRRATRTRLVRTSRRAADVGTLQPVDVGVRVHLRDVETLDDVAVVTAPAPVEPDDIIANLDEVFVVEAVLWTPRDSRCVPVLERRLRSRRVELGETRASICRAPADRRNRPTHVL